MLFEQFSLECIQLMHHNPQQWAVTIPIIVDPVSVLNMVDNHNLMQPQKDYQFYEKNRNKNTIVTVQLRHVIEMPLVDYCNKTIILFKKQKKMLHKQMRSSCLYSRSLLNSDSLSLLAISSGISRRYT